jgi:hypothetical protein
MLRISHGGGITVTVNRPELWLPNISGEADYAFKKNGLFMNWDLDISSYLPLVKHLPMADRHMIRIGPDMPTTCKWITLVFVVPDF